MNRHLALICMICLIIGTLHADNTNKPSLQIADNTFFDPTKKEKKVETYEFGVDYRIEVGYVQHQQRPQLTFPDLYLHGTRVGATFDFHLPLHFDIQTGVFYTLLLGINDQHWRSTDISSTQTEYIHHRILAHNLTIPVRVYYTIPIWKKLNLFFYTGPQLHIGLAQNDYLQTHLSASAQQWLETKGVSTTPYDRMENELVRANIQYGIGGGLEWDRYRLQSGYDFGLNNLIKKPQMTSQYMSEWGWYISFSYRL